MTTNENILENVKRLEENMKKLNKNVEKLEEDDESYNDKVGQIIGDIIYFGAVLVLALYFKK